MQGAVGGQAPPTPHSIAPHPNAGRPGIDRAHTFPTPPTSASSVMGIGNQGGSYDSWGSQNLPNGVNGSQPLSIDTGLNARSMPTTPATTPPSNTQQGMPGYQGQPGYDKNVYNGTPGSQPGYPPHPDSRYGQPASYKTEMGPPTGPPGSAPLADSHDQGHGHGQGQDEHAENGYAHGNATPYSANQG
ncbi:MAG: hypothetical protein M1823_007032, partial [Watsoniomyces obsoletus]